MKPREHADLIKLWADGATIQCLDQKTGNWYDSPVPYWVDRMTFRVKPREFPETSYTGKELSRVWNLTQGHFNGLIQVANAAIKRYIEDTEQSSHAQSPL